MISRIILFLIINFVGLAIGGILMGNGSGSEWYQSINKAPWTPPGWVFGFAWTTIMICFAGYMSFAWEATINKGNLISLFALQWALNILWTPVFFHFHKAGLGLIIIISLTTVIGIFLIIYWPGIKLKSILILPYFLWLIIATSLNGYIYLKN